ncbi:MAG TPA: hypothetical protein VF755_14860 [Catenuloplanes sp.]|jgi:hypothetical protein
MRQDRYRTTVWRLTARVRPVWAAVAVTCLAIALLVSARVVDGFNRELLLNLGASLAFVPPTYLVFAPIFERIRQTAAAIEEHLVLDIPKLIGYIARSHSKVWVLETWTGLLEDAHRPAFLDALTVALGNGVTVQILLLDPTSAAAHQRAEELDDAAVPGLITDNLRYLYEFRRTLDDNRRRLLDVRVYDASPSVQLYRWDDKAFVSFFPIGKRAYDTRQIETYLANPLGEFAESRFDGLWSATTTYPLEHHMTMVLCVHHADRSPAEHRVAFVRTGEEIFVDGDPFIGTMTDHGIGALTVRLGPAENPTRRDGEVVSYRLERLANCDPGFVGSVPKLFEGKYGDAGKDGRFVIHLRPAAVD